MFINKQTLASYVSGIFFSIGSKDADGLVAEILKNLDLAELMTARAKAAAFKCRSNRATYERYLKQPETKRRRASINKQQALRASFYSAKCIGEDAIRRMIVASEALIKLLPLMMEDSKYDHPSSDDRLSRSSNCVLVSRFLTGLSEYAAHLRAGWNMEEKDRDDLAHGASDFINLASNATDLGEKCEHIFQESLDIFFVRGIADATFAEVENRLDRLNAAVERGNQLLQAHADAKSRYLNDEQFKARMADAASPEASQQVLDAYNAAMLDFDHVNWALTMVSHTLFVTHDAAEKALLDGKSSLTRLGYDSVLQGNMMHLRVQMARARALRRSVQQVLDTKRNDLRPYYARQAAFQAIPAVFRLPKAER